MDIHKEKELFLEIIETAADYYKYEPSHIEKDYYVTKILKELSLTEYNGQVFFKGGTSLSKAYGLIHRFSEDLDMLTYTGDITASKSKEKSLNKKTCDIIIESNNVMYKPELSKVGGNFRKLYFDYDNNFEKNGLKQHLEVEIKACDLSDKSLIYYPNETKVINSIIGEFLNDINREDLIEQYGLEAFAINCINPRRTICDKISRLVKLSYRDEPIEEFAKHIRDFYDLFAILSKEEYKSFLNSEDFFEAMYRTTVEDQLMKNTKTDKPLNEALIFTNTDEILSHPNVQKAYKEGLGSLFFANSIMPLMDEIKQTIKNIALVLPDFEKYRNKREKQIYESKNEYSSISIYPNNTNTQWFIRCKINSEQQCAKKLQIADVIAWNKLNKTGTLEEKETFKKTLASTYYSDVIDIKNNKTIKR